VQPKLVDTLNKQLPVFAAIRHTFSLTFNNLGPALRVTWAWIAVLIVAIGLMVLVIAVAGFERGSMPGGLFVALVFIFFFILALVATASIAVAWHRYILLDEGGSTKFNLRFDGTVWRYVGNAMAITIGAMIAFAVPATLLLMISEYMFVVIIPGIILLSPFMYRLFIKLPAIALERRDFSFYDAYEASAGNYWQLVGLAVTYALISIALNLLIGIVSFVGLLFGPFAVVVQVIGTAAAQWIGIIFGISLLTTLYGFFVEGRSFDD